MNADGVLSTVTNFDIFIKRTDGSFKLKLKHDQSEDQCVTYIRDGVVSYKCYGGVGEGSIDLWIKEH